MPNTFLKKFSDDFLGGAFFAGVAAAGVAAAGAGALGVGAAVTAGAIGVGGKVVVGTTVFGVTVSDAELMAVGVPIAVVEGLEVLSAAPEDPAAVEAPPLAFWTNAASVLSTAWAP